jgi:hypothetical protein
LRRSNEEAFVERGSHVSPDSSSGPCHRLNADRSLLEGALLTVPTPVANGFIAAFRRLDPNAPASLISDMLVE